MERLKVTQEMVEAGECIQDLNLTTGARVVCVVGVEAEGFSKGRHYVPRYSGLPTDDNHWIRFQTLSKFITKEHYDELIKKDSEGVADVEAGVQLTPDESKYLLNILNMHQGVVGERSRCILLLDKLSKALNKIDLESELKETEAKAASIKQQLEQL